MFESYFNHAEACASKTAISVMLQMVWRRRLQVQAYGGLGRYICFYISLIYIYIHSHLSSLYFAFKCHFFSFEEKSNVWVASEDLYCLSIDVLISCHVRARMIVYALCHGIDYIALMYLKHMIHAKKKTLTFHTGCLIGILIMVCCNPPHNWAV